MLVVTTKLQHRVRHYPHLFALMQQQLWLQGRRCGDYHDQFHYLNYGRLNLIFINTQQINYFQNDKMYSPR
jgi:hypothetical protein